MTRPDPHDGGYQGGVEHAVDFRVVRERLAEVALEHHEVRLEGADAAIELGVAQEL